VVPGNISHCTGYSHSIFANSSFVSKE